MGSKDLSEELLGRALQLKASDIHLDPGEHGLTARMRVDGRFTAREEVDGEVAQRLIGRLKVMADLMVYRSDIPQEGRLLLPDGSEARLALIPTPRGEKATLRIFASGIDLERLDSLGLGVVPGDWLRTQLRADSGLVLVVGPSGSGKTSTLYAAMTEIAAERGDFCQLTSIEDPVERQLDGCTQVEVDPTRSLDFATGLKYLLRQDPEIIMVGEIRDAETARVAVRAAMTGHLVLSSLHCGHAAEARPRLLEMGVEDYAVKIALIGAMAQRLLRRVCASCAGAGCERCLGNGYSGRTVVAEIDDSRHRWTSPAMVEAARTLVEAGRTTEDEVSRVFGGER